MLFGFFYFDWTILLVIPAMLFAIFAQFKVNSTFERFSKVNTRSGMTAAQAARRMLDANGLSHIPVEIVRGHLSDHYDPRRKVLRLSEAVYHGNNVAAVGVAAHEAGHALQDAHGYVPLRFRIALVPVVLHLVWNTQWLAGFGLLRFLVLGIIAWGVALRLVQAGLHQIREEQRYLGLPD